jgi:uncharacterized protein YkwD
MAAFAGVLLLWLAVPPAHAQTGDGPPQSEVPLVATLDAQPPAVSPGESLSYILTLYNAHDVDYRITISATLPAGFELSAADLPAGSAYTLRSGNLQWTGVVDANSERVLTFSGITPVDPRADGRLTMHAALVTAADSQSAPASTPNQVTHISATGWVGTSPTVSFTHVIEEQTVRFNSLSEGVGPLSIWWDFGDGATSTEANPDHQYSQSGDYTVRLTVANPIGSSTASQMITISPEIIDQVPSPYQILINDDTPAVGQPVYLSNLTEPISVTVLWNFGNGVISNDLNPTHVFQEPGVFTITQVLGEGAAAIQSFRTVTVDYPPQASIAIDRPTVPINQLVTFSAQTSTPGALTYFWDFGDGNLANSAAVAHSFDSPGVYPVTLAVSNDFGVTLDTLEVHVANYTTIYLPLVSGAAGPAPVETPVPETGIPAEPVEEVEAEPVVPLPADPLAQEILQAINAEREAVGLVPLSWSDKLVRSAQHHSDDMATHWFTGHYGSNGSRPVDRMRQASYTGDYAGECTAWGFDDIASAVAWWMSSPPHRVIILSTVATEIGGAYTYNPNAPSVHYWTVDFGAD